MQTSFFLDYFIQSVYVGNIGTDIMCSYNGIEPRNIFIKKNVIKFALNLPVKYKINSKYFQNMKLKYIVKKIFLDFFPKKLIYKKQGFSGFPNESKILIRNRNFSKVNYLLKKKFVYNNNYSRSDEWKIINLELFFQFNKKLLKKINIF